ncbi:MAG: SDR family NAD(P)-dependent oxidoreductase [Nannocystaceae bacterium]
MPSHVFVTGTNSGFGRLAALTLARRGHRVFATMREPGGKHRVAADELRIAAQSMPGSISVYAMDLAMGGGVEPACEQVLADAGHLDVVINNAGLIAMGLAESMTDQQVLYQLDVNVVGHHRVLRALLPSLRERGQGLLVHISSTLSRMVMPTFGVHSACAAGLEALVDAYRLELAPLGVECTIVQPGLHPTGFVDRVQVGDDYERSASYGPNADAADRMGELVRQRIGGATPPNPQIVADTIAMLVELQPGTRPERFVVDDHDASQVLRLNDVHRRVQAELQAKLGAVLGRDDGSGPEPEGSDG